MSEESPPGCWGPHYHPHLIPSPHCRRGGRGPRGSPITQTPCLWLPSSEIGSGLAFAEPSSLSRVLCVNWQWQGACSGPGSLRLPGAVPTLSLPRVAAVGTLTGWGTASLGPLVFLPLDSGFPCQLSSRPEEKVGSSGAGTGIGRVCLECQRVLWPVAGGTALSRGQRLFPARGPTSRLRQPPERPPTLTAERLETLQLLILLFYFLKHQSHGVSDHSPPVTVPLAEREWHKPCSGRPTRVCPWSWRGWGVQVTSLTRGRGTIRCDGWPR